MTDELNKHDYSEPAAVMTLRDHIAVQAMASIISKLEVRGVNFSGDVGQENVSEADRDNIMDSVSRGAYRYADAMLRARKK